MNHELKALCESIFEQAKNKPEKPYILAIDGRCAAGKTTLAAFFEEVYGCTVFHMDDFFLRPEQRQETRLNEPGGNVDYERFAEEVLNPIVNGCDPISYRAYDCKSQTLHSPRMIHPKPFIVVEGSYSCHPALWDAYDCRIFLTISSDEQTLRILKRNGEAGSRMFCERWIPMEETYFKAYRIGERCDYCCSMDEGAREVRLNAAADAPGITLGRSKRGE